MCASVQLNLEFGLENTKDFIWVSIHLREFTDTELLNGLLSLEMVEASRENSENCLIDFLAQHISPSTFWMSELPVLNVPTPRQKRKYAFIKFIVTTIHKIKLFK